MEYEATIRNHLRFDLDFVKKHDIASKTLNKAFAGDDFHEIALMYIYLNQKEDAKKFLKEAIKYYQKAIEEIREKEYNNKYDGCRNIDWIYFDLIKTSLLLGDFKLAENAAEKVSVLDVISGVGTRFLLVPAVLDDKSLFNKCLKKTSISKRKKRYIQAFITSTSGLIERDAKKIENGIKIFTQRSMHWYSEDDPPSCYFSYWATLYKILSNFRNINIDPDLSEIPVYYGGLAKAVKYDHPDKNDLKKNEFVTEVEFDIKHPLYDAEFDFKMSKNVNGEYMPILEGYTRHLIHVNEKVGFSVKLHRQELKCINEVGIRFFRKGKYKLILEETSPERIFEFDVRNGGEILEVRQLSDEKRSLAKKFFDCIRLKL